MMSCQELEIRKTGFVIRYPRQKKLGPIVDGSRTSRTIYDIMYNILDVVHKSDIKGINKTKIVLNSSCGGSQTYLVDLIIKLGLIKERDCDGRKYKLPDHVHTNVVYYVITPKGLAYMQIYKELISFLRLEKE